MGEDNFKGEVVLPPAGFIFFLKSDVVKVEAGFCIWDWSLHNGSRFNFFLCNSFILFYLL